jgi:hypothetical protein
LPWVIRALVGVKAPPMQSVKVKVNCWATLLPPPLNLPTTTKVASTHHRERIDLDLHQGLRGVIVVEEARVGPQAQVEVTRSGGIATAAATLVVVESVIILRPTWVETCVEIPQVWAVEVKVVPRSGATISHHHHQRMELGI